MMFEDQAVDSCIETLHRRVNWWRICFSYHVIWSLATRRHREIVWLDRRQNASSDSIPPSSVYYKRLMHARCRLPALSDRPSCTATPSGTRHVFVACVCVHVLHFFLSSLGLLDLSPSAGASPFKARSSVFLMVSFVLSSSFFCSLSSACCLF
jgi:hypothetical protein